MEAVLQPIVHQSPKHALFNTTHPARCLILHARVSSFDLSSKIKVEWGGVGEGVIGVDVSIGGGGGRQEVSGCTTFVSGPTGNLAR